MSAIVTRDILVESLVRLSAEILKLVGDLRFKPRTRIFLRRIVTEIRVDKDDIPTGGVRFEDHVFERPSGISVDKCTELKPLFQDTVNAIALAYDWQKSNAEFWARQFVSWTSERILSAKYRQSVVDESIQTFMADLEKTPLKATVRIFLLGITPRRPSISIGDNLTVRKVSKQDLSLEYDVAFPPPKQPFPHSIAEIDMDVRDRMNLLEHQRTANKLVSILKLFKPWSIRWTKWSITFPTIMPFGDLYNVSYPILGVKNNILETSDERILEKLYNVLLPMMPVDGDFRSGTDAVSIAYKLYTEALTNQGGSDWKIATVVAGLDALYVQGGVDQTYKLAYRAAKLLGLLGETPEEACKIIKESYSIRSRVFHGDKLSAKQSKVVPEYLSLMYEYLRKSILLFFFVTKKQGSSKNSIIKCIDNSFLGRSGERELHKMLETTNRKIGFDFEELGIGDH